MRSILAWYVGKLKALWDTPSPMLKLPPKVNPTSLSVCIDAEKFLPTAEITRKALLLGKALKKWKIPLIEGYYQFLAL